MANSCPYSLVCLDKTSDCKWSCQPLPLNVQSPVPKDIEIARSVLGKPIDLLCREIGITKFELHGKYKAKITSPVPKINPQCQGNYVVVTGITPTPMGEGKSTTTLGLAQSLSAHMDKNCFACIRQPSQGPTFGLKGGAAGGGYSQVWPMDDFNLHLTGDIHAVTAANNLIAAAIDARIFHESTQSDEDLFRRLVSKPGAQEFVFNELQKKRLLKLGISTELKPMDLNLDQRKKFARLNIDPDSITLTRVIDTNDRFLRKITIGQAATEKGRTRETKFAISVASELMAILALATDMEDVCVRVGRMVIGFSLEADRCPITCDDLCVSGGVCALLKDAIYPTLMQTLEGSPVLVHCGPFANVAHGNSSIIADKLALHMVGSNGFVVTEAGFASDVGFEKFMDIKCRASGLMPDCAILVATIRALKWHGRELLSSTSARAEIRTHEDEMEVLKSGTINLIAHIRNIRENFNVPVIVALNKFSDDLSGELEVVRDIALKAGAYDCCINDNWAQGGKGAVKLAQSLIDLCNSSKREVTKPKLLYELENGVGDENANGDKVMIGLSILEKIELVAKKVYCAERVEFPEHVIDKAKTLEANGFGKLPVCIAKTHLSISHDPKLKGHPKGYTFPIVNLEVSAGAGFVYALAGEISTMPGLTTRPAFFDIKLDWKTGQVDGLF